jgi:alginate O-acetyltransferase complex protein AlgI
MASLFFYAWGENIFSLLILSSIAVSYVFGLAISNAQKKGRSGKPYLVMGVLSHLGILGFFKYANFFIATYNTSLASANKPPVEWDEVHLPIGISFFTFQALSYIVDVYRKQSEVQRNPINTALYVSLFPQLIAGPIVRYNDVARELSSRRVTAEDISYGAYRFLVGLAKKVLIANSLAGFVDYAFALHVDNMTAGIAWLAVFCYTLQIYFDFSGYSDMAIGLGRMFGFHFLENFDFPYISKSIREFWRRWHISLSSWFRDYLYIPLGGNRNSPLRTYLNLVVVFFLCGLWHGASWNFVIWGLFHGLFLILERTAFGRFQNKWPSLLRFAYTLTLVMIAWVFFRAETLTIAFDFLSAMFGFNTGSWVDAYFIVKFNNEVFFYLVVGVIFMTPINSFLKKEFTKKLNKTPKWVQSFLPRLVTAGQYLAILTMFILCAAKLASNTYNPFIYFQF